MVLHLDRQALVVRVERGAAGDRPRLEHAVQLQAQVVVQPGGIVLLDHEAEALGRGHARPALRLGRAREVALGLVE